MTGAFATLDGSTVPWKSITVSRSLDAFVGSATVTVPLTPSSVTAPGGRMIVSASGDGPEEALLRGFVDAISGAGDVSGGELVLECRDRTADLVDGARIGQSVAWYSNTLLEVASDLARPYGIRVVDDASANKTPVRNLIGQPGETGFAILDRAVRLSGVLLSTSPEGYIVLGTPSRERAPAGLCTGRGGNVLRWSWRTDHSQRFRRVQVRGTSQLAGLVEGAAWRFAGVAEDPAVRAEREAIILAQGDLLGDELDALASWHVTVARARASTLTVETPRWRVVEGARVWRPGMLVPVEIAEAGVSGEFLVAAVELSWSDQGELARLGLVPPDAYEIDPTEAARLRRGNVGALVE